LRSIKALQEIEGVHEDKPSVDEKDLYLVRAQLKEGLETRKKKLEEEKEESEESDESEKESENAEDGGDDKEEEEEKDEKKEDKDQEELEEEIEHVKVLLDYIDESFAST